jgi:hypothetical protein
MIPVAAGLVILFSAATGRLSAQSAADGLWMEFNSVAWRQPLPEWQKSHPQAVCRSSQSDAYWANADEQWTHRCTRPAIGGLSLEWSFYAFDSTEPIETRLEMFRGQIELPNRIDLMQAFQSLAARLKSRLGAGQAATNLHEFGAAFWRDPWRWNAAESEVYLYHREEDGDLLLYLFARHRSLLGAMAEDDRLNQSAWDPAGVLRAEYHRQLAETLRSSFPNLAMALNDDPADDALRKDADSPRVVADTLLLLLQAAEQTTDAQQAPLLLAADELAAKLGTTNDLDDPEWREQRQAWVRHGMNYEWNQLGASWVYQRDLLRRVWKETPGGTWGEWAFLQLLAAGWDTSGACAEGTDSFRKVIEQGEPFLKNAPRSAHAMEVRLALAQAHETWWSLSQASPERDDYADAAQYQDGSAVARERAIALYEEIMRNAAAGPQAEKARRQLPRLKLGIDTNQRQYFCIYD